MPPLSGVQLFMVVFAIISVAISGWGLWRASTASGVPYRLLWIGGSLLGFVGFATNVGRPGDMSLQLGVQIPVLMWFMNGLGDFYLKAMFPIVALVVLVKFRPPSSKSDS
jgi:hypothetical protein